MALAVTNGETPYPGLEERTLAVKAAADGFVIGFREEFREVRGCRPGGEAGGDGEIVMG